MLRRLVLATLICIALLTVACIGGGRGYDSARRVISSALADEAGNTYVAYRAERSPGDHDIHVLKIDREGRKLWDKTLFTGDNRRSSILGIVKDGGGGVFIAWEVLKSENGKEGHHHFDRDFLAKVDGQGEIKLEQDFLFRITDMAADGTGGVTLRRITSAERYVLRLDGEGSTLWEYPLSSQCTGLQLAAGDEGEWFILWRHAENFYFIVQKLGADGQTLWRDDGAPASRG